ncbi:hypothetical protein F2Q69_00023257 [Brassica cretica]|uniref:Uncharacterized protein n=1 Tax=Brassica cretica TaxID=69181 RepID=A0A8S9Q6I1_BRACR|nr:hypothetical protein F2Q69_00023257 [Brassica cretica]
MTSLRERLLKASDNGSWTTDPRQQNTHRLTRRRGKLDRMHQPIRPFGELDRASPTRQTGELDRASRPTRLFGELDRKCSLTRPFGELDQSACLRPVLVAPPPPLGLDQTFSCFISIGVTIGTLRFKNRKNSFSRITFGLIE